MGVNVFPAGPIYPVHFSPTETLPSPPANPGPISDYYKTTFLVKYDTNGQFVWKRALQGDVNWTNYDSGVLDILIDSNDTIHFIVGFKGGTHLNNTVTVPNTVSVYQYYLVRYSSSGQLLNSTLLPVADGTGFVPPSFTFKLDEANNRYYIAGFRSYSNVNEDIPLTYGGSAIINNAYILAIDAGTGSEIWRREMQPEGLVFHDNRIYDLDVDTNGDIYIAGKLFKGSSENGVIKIINPKNPAVNAYTFNITSIQGNMPFIARLNKNGVVQWARTPTNDVSNMYYSHSLALRGNEVALATEGGSGMVWDSFSMSRPAGVGYQPDPVLVRFSKQTGTVVGLHDIEGNMTYDKLTVVEVDNDGNYVVGGAFKSNLFGTHPTINMLVTNGHYDFFAAKLAASVCGTPVSNEEFNKLNVNVYPNPTTDIVNIETAETLQSYEVYNVLGQQIQKGNFNGNTQINLHGATAGTYFIKVTTTQGSADTVKVVKK